MSRLSSGFGEKDGPTSAPRFNRWPTRAGQSAWNIDPPLPEDHDDHELAVAEPKGVDADVEHHLVARHLFRLVLPVVVVADLLGEDESPRVGQRVSGRTWVSAPAGAAEEGNQARSQSRRRRRHPPVCVVLLLYGLCFRPGLPFTAGESGARRAPRVGSCGGPVDVGLKTLRARGAYGPRPSSGRRMKSRPTGARTGVYGGRKKGRRVKNRGDGGPSRTSGRDR